MKTYMTPEEHARLHRRRARQALGLLVAVLVLVGAVTVVRAGVRTVANLFDDTQQRQEYEDKLEGLVLFDPVPFDGIENIDDLTLREAAVWGCVYSIQETQGGFDNYNTDPDTEQLLLPSVDVDAYLAKLVGPSFKMTHKSFEMDVPGNVAGTKFDDTGKIPVSTGTSSKDIVQEVTDVGTMSIHVGANQDQVIRIDIPEVTTYTLGIDTVNVMTGLTASQSIEKVDKAINRASSVRSKIGSYQNRFEHTQNNIAVSNENLTSALSAMTDTDMAEEMTEYTSVNVMTQAATSILAQANERPSTVLQILQ